MEATQVVNMLGTTKAGRNDDWSAYTHIEVGERGYEIRHPLKDGGVFNVWRWSNTYGHTYWDGGFSTLEDAIAAVARTA